MNNTILVAIDFSPCSEQALDQAVAIAKKANSNIELLWVKTFNDKNFGTDISNLINIGIKSRFAELEKKYSISIGQSRIKHTTIEGNRVYDVVADYAKKTDPYLVVIGTHGTTDNSKEVGSNTYRVIDSVDRSVLVVNNNDKDKTIKKIVLPIDSTPETHQKVPMTAWIAKNCGAEINILGVFSSRSQNAKDRVSIYITQTIEYLEKNRVRYVKDEVNTNKIVDSIIKYSVDSNADMISIMDEQESHSLSFWSTSPMHQILNSSPIPILVTHMKDTMIIFGK